MQATQHEQVVVVPSVVQTHPVLGPWVQVARLRAGPVAAYPGSWPALETVDNPVAAYHGSQPALEPADNLAAAYHGSQPALELAAGQHGSRPVVEALHALLPMLLDVQPVVARTQRHLLLGQLVTSRVASSAEGSVAQTQLPENAVG